MEDTYEEESSGGETLTLVESFRQLRALVIGDVMVDTYLEGHADRLCSEGPVPVVAKTARYCFPGGAANTAANLAALGAEVMLVGFVAADSAGQMLRSALTERNIADSWLVTDPQGTTLHKLRILADGQYVVRFDEGGPFQSEEACAQLRTYVEQLYAQCDLLVISDYRYGVITEELLHCLASLSARQPKAIIVDSKALWRFKDLPITVVTPNYSEACVLIDGGSGATGKLDLVDVERVALALLALLKTEQVAITLGAYGVFLLNRAGKKRHCPAHQVAQAHDVGAGDSFTAALALALGAGGSLEEAAQIGLDAASIAVTRRWTSTVQYQELLQRVSVRVYSSHAQEKRGESMGPARQIAALLERERARGKTIVFTNGIFDILHAGHVEFLRQARALGDLLIVGVNSDRGAWRRKGVGRPINNERDRLSLVAALDMVDHALLFDEETPEQLIRLLRPAIHVKGGDYRAEVLPEAQAVREAGGQIVILPLAGSMSTDKVIAQIAALASMRREQPTYAWGETL